VEHFLSKAVLYTAIKKFILLRNKPPAASTTLTHYAKWTIFYNSPINFVSPSPFSYNYQICQCCEMFILCL